MIKFLKDRETFVNDHVGDDAFKEGQQARKWRENSGLSRRKLAELTGYAESSIAAIERGEWGPDKPVDPNTFKTYRLTCAAVALGVIFDWDRLELTPRGVVQITIPLQSEE